jgi:hypothetical protein
MIGSSNRLKRVESYDKYDCKLYFVNIVMQALFCSIKATSSPYPPVPKQHIPRKYIGSVDQHNAGEAQPTPKEKKKRSFYSSVLHHKRRINCWGSPAPAANLYNLIGMNFS